ncbi:dihydrolipoyllysine-residue acetyltransferase component of pyruvate dehydrogenase complex [Anaplasma platys]|uniref:Acetyltransferase component of pyruvate dehydrogenase complex n=1 Tax=Anaplasma platys TaxID=949 RepID=A0A858PZA1_9RICK|nr:pyruvate dehydrogenase complex dihydrolipoamide acetyltransferase [Anaplasma platys]QJC27909.1 dihydrolipoyllysine-residue acetyltransferase component of pyruvate dehydrogenase complex [Anaplasma platys]
MPVKILMPALSPTMKSGTLTKWHKKVGDTLKPGDIIADVETDKAVIEFEYVDEPGTLYKILRDDGAAGVTVNQVIAVVKVDGDDDASLLAAVSEPAQLETKPINKEITKSDGTKDTTPETSMQAPAAAAETRVKASPLAKKVAAQLGVDIREVVGTGPYGRVVKDDVVNAQGTRKPQNAHSTEPTEVEISGMRRVIAERLVEAKRSIPHFYLAVDCTVGELIATRSKINLNAGVLQTKITVNDFVIKAAALAVREFPQVNSSWQGDKILCLKDIDVAFAVALDDGLITPVIKNADLLSLSELSKTVKSLAARAKERKLLPDEFQGGGMTVSNLGMFGIKEFYAIVNPPQSCIMAVGRSEQRPVIVDGSVVVKDVMTVTLSVDHRVIDGATAARFLDRFKFYIENPLAMLV